MNWLAPSLGIAAVGLGAFALKSAPSERPIGSYCTSVTARTASQRHNARLALESLQGAVIGPGETFSFNQEVGTFSRDAGYRKAPVSFNGQLIDDWGGGVCQTSTTLYNAALLAGLEIKERHSHRFAPSYVPVGRDAAVAFSHIDLKLRNPYAFPVRIVGEIDRGQLTLRLLATQAPPLRPTIVSELNDYRPAATLHVGQSGGRRRVRTTGKAGADVTIYREWPNGRRELISHKAYPAMARVVEYRG